MALNSALVENGWIKGFAIEPGRNVDYRAGRCLMWGGTRHQTVGRCGGDRSIGLRGTFNAYVPRSRACGPGWTMFAQLDAVCFHNCEWNQELTGCEVEWLPGEDFTDYQIEGCGLWVAGNISIGVPDVDLRRAGTARFRIGERIGGFVDHSDLEHRACDQHTDGWEPWWPAIRAAAARWLGQAPPVPLPPPERKPKTMNHYDNGQYNAEVFVAPNGDLVQKGFDTKNGKAGWPTAVLNPAPNAKALFGADIDIRSPYLGDPAHIFVQHENGRDMVHVAVKANLSTVVSVE